ncbi:MAG: TonB-dependent receptor, partial [Bacteroidota bacterium]
RSPNRSLLFFTLLLLFFNVLSAQGGDHPKGIVLDDAGYPLIGATVRWVGGSGTTTDQEGAFHLVPEAGKTHMAVSYIGFAPAEVQIDTAQFPITIVLVEGTSLTEVEVTARDKGSFTSLLSGRNIESLTTKELRKAPCCSLAESFENSPVVDLTYGDPLTGRREIQMLGLRGNYTQLTLEKRPALTGLATPYALDLIPGPWVSGIQIGKGSGSVESGASGLTGQINTELRKPAIEQPLYVDLFGGTQGRGEANLVINQRISENLTSNLLLHGGMLENKHDHDFDRFKDMPDRRSGAGLYRLFRQGKGQWEGQWNILAAIDRREGGQQDVHDHGQPTLDPFLINQANDHIEIWGKTAFFGFRKPHQSLGIIYSGSYHELNNLYGRKVHIGKQRSGYLNALYHTQVWNDQHQLSLGTSFQHDDIVESLADQDYDRRENTVGAFSEYTYNWGQYDPAKPYRAFTAIVSLRLDHHNLGGWQASPRVNVKYNPSENTAFRLSAGRGWRSPNILVENLNWLPSSRNIQLVGQMNAQNPGYLGLETAWNFGANFTQNFTWNDREGTFLIDFFRTVFQDQIVIDVEQDLANLFIYQLDGTSRANNIMASFTYEVLPLVDIKLAYKYNDVQTSYATNGQREVPLTPRHRALATLDYDGRRFKANINYQWVGSQRLPDHDLIPETVWVPHPQVAPAFGLLNAQVTYVANSRLELYSGGENLTNRTQRNAIIGAWEPFDGGYFDATQVYQPLFQRRFYVGLRYTVNR